ncbi:hypothetical protein [Blastomonas sp.]|jgi:hypothetical protein|uniref:hypothetical protein n=1 Tax=Blastomonas sp. TaxID=1909299 RepID=UPI00406A9C6B
MSRKALLASLGQYSNKKLNRGPGLPLSRKTMAQIALCPCPVLPDHDEIPVNQVVSQGFSRLTLILPSSRDQAGIRGS